jgi:hydroxypyruvate reductase
MDYSQLRQDAARIYQAALEAVGPYDAVKRALDLQGSQLRVAGETLDLAAFNKIVAVGAGKAGAPMSQALEAVLGDRLETGLVVVKDGHAEPTETIEIVEASHPVPDQRGVEAAGRIASLLEEHRAPDTLVFCLLSGGGSALMVSPAQGISLADKQETTRLLLSCGADIGQINAVRKHLSQVKGGQLARLACPGRVITLIISDVVGDYLDVIASGPTVADTSTWQDCQRILNDYRIWDQTPPAVRARIEQGLAGGTPETPKAGDAELAGVRNLIVAGNIQALNAASAQARELGYRPLILSSTIEGDTAEVARVHAALAREVRSTANPLEPPCCLISGGETTVQLGDNPGQGGRNQEFALAAAQAIEGLENVLVVCLGTDGTDGPTDAAGALADGRTMARAREAGLDPKRHLSGHDAYPFFAKLDDLIVTGPTRTNVMDLRLVMVG